MVSPIMDPETYTAWYNAWMKKYGSLLGAEGADEAGATPAE